MARKRLSPVTLTQVDATAPSTSPAPIAQVAGGSAAAAALEEVSAELSRARADGRLIQEIPLNHINTGWIIRDRLRVDAEELQVLKDSIAAHGQRTPIELVQDQGGEKPYGLISGLRRVLALKALFDETGDAKFAKVNAILRTPETAQDAYVSMIEENEIRVGLSYYERARLAADAVRARVFGDEKHALQVLFANVSRAKRSKIKSFVDLHNLLEGELKFGDAISERMGLQLTALLKDRPGTGKIIADTLRKLPDRSEAEELELLNSVLTLPATAPAQNRADKPVSHAKPLTAKVGSVSLTLKGPEGAQLLELKGQGVNKDLFERLEAVLKGQPS